MQEAIRNRDFTFRLPTNGLLSGERAMQQTLNQLGDVIRQQVNQSEVESWERLTRVLTHEIMNATAPIASISQSMLSRKDVKGTPLEEGIQTIYHTSQHLSSFVDSYRKLSSLQAPAIEQVALAAVVKDISLFYPDIQWQCRLADSAVVSADPNMLRQILINLVKNAIEAGANRIAMEYDDDSRLLVSNDGQPIPAEARKSIFVPFFTTKRTGSGIGLSLSRQMMIRQGGNLMLTDHPRSGYLTTFALEFAKGTPPTV
ncbi:MAG: HAMP domain-containing histidine kinase [Prevotella sp.]|nr:HAMP domain-containing histidine kinase [Prevotella sp.]